MRGHRTFRPTLILPVLVLALPQVVWAQGAGVARQSAFQPPDLQWEYMGPPSSGRFSAVAGVPGDTTTYYLGSASGGVWKTSDAGLPAAPVSWVVVEPRYHDVVISTYGRGLFVLRDITRLEQADRVRAGAPVHLFEPRPGFRMARTGNASFLFALDEAPAEPVHLEILAADASHVRSMEVDAEEGLNGVVWDLLYDSPAQVELRTVPPDNPFIWGESRFEGQDTRPIVHWGIRSPQTRGPLATPGEYTIRVTVDGQTVSQPFSALTDAALKWMTTLENELEAAGGAYDDLIGKVVPAFNRVWSGRVGSVTPLPSGRGNERN